MPLLALLLLAPGPTQTHDVTVYGATSAGVVAAVQVRSMGRTVLLIDPDDRLGGLSSGGLGATDIGSAAAIGGRSRDFYRRVASHYADDEAWVHEARADFRRSSRMPGGDTMWAFEPRVAHRIFESMIEEHEIEVWRGERLDRSERGIEVDDGAIAAIRTESGREARARVFIDATYEGDLMALAGVSYVVGREGEAEFSESLAGVRTELAIHHQFVRGVDPYRTPGDPTSGLLPGIDPNGPGAEGSGDHRVQAYCIRMCFTDVAANRLPVPRPSTYDPLAYELLLRNFDAGADVAPWHPIAMPNRKTDTNNNRGVSTDFIGQSYAWAEASYAERAALYDRHLHWQQGLVWTLANHERVPSAIRDEVARWGPPKDEFVDNGGWSPQLYVREARRMRSDLVMTEHHCRGTEVAPHPVGLAAYTMDSHNVQRHVDAEGHVRNEGDVQVRVPHPFRIGYEALRPREDECTNLLVTCCPSASHVAFGSIRMEPVFMILGQSAGTAACHAIEQGTTVQGIDHARLDARLRRDGQVLDPPPARSTNVGVALGTLDGLALDETAAELVGFATPSRATEGFVGDAYRHDGNADKGAQTATFRPDVPEAGTYEVLAAWTAHANRASNARWTVRHADGATVVIVDQRKAPDEGVVGTLGRWRFEQGATELELSNEGTDGYVILDAVVLRRVDGLAR